jgi:hypothetical protein
MPVQAPVLAVSTWSVHRAIGVSYPNSPGDEAPAKAEPTRGPGSLSLMELPGALQQLGIDRIEICSFHIPAHDRGFVGELRGALADSGVVLQTLLIDDGDIILRKAPVVVREGLLEILHALKGLPVPERERSTVRDVRL